MLDKLLFDLQSVLIYKSLLEVHQLQIQSLHTFHVGTRRRWDIDTNTTLTSTFVKCIIGNMIAWSHCVVVQSKKGAIKNSSSINNLVFEISITSVSPSSLRADGGQVLTINGQFFQYL